MRYIALNEDAEPISAPVPQSDGRISDEACLNVLAALHKLHAAALGRTRAYAVRDMPEASRYYAGQSAAYTTAMAMLQGLLTGEFAVKCSSVDEIIDATTLD